MLITSYTVFNSLWIKNWIFIKRFITNLVVVALFHFCSHKALQFKHFQDKQNEVAFSRSFFILTYLHLNLQCTIIVQTLYIYTRSFNMQKSCSRNFFNRLLNLESALGRLSSDRILEIEVETVYVSF